MAFGRRRVEEPPMETVGWADVQTFVVSSVERPVTVKRKHAVRGKPAVRVARGSRDLRILAPCAFLGTTDTQQPGLPSRPHHTLYETETRGLLCYVEPAVDSAGELRHVVRDGRGECIGTVVRVPRKRRPFKHTWRIEQPGHPEIVGRNEWASGDAKEIAGRFAAKILEEVVDNALSGGEGSDRPSKPRSLEWRAENKVVMVSEGSDKVTVRKGWVDRRLAFAFALLGDR
ncbi:hypothetical protein [Streptomyces sp. CB01373]|uniref:hypothetical protein n=1 Tax=Streptomyces sp. CB01373 TaxID=2020325 RepID=UPI000C27E13B|nr:hypothetical protein [Streptomyces sp. CB01373]PJM94083.1 hypothetical protein CG719_17600 [Streptomyces sp. CB01373]